LLFVFVPVLLLTDYMSLVSADYSTGFSTYFECICY
jgi:hypothetical protein